MWLEIGSDVVLTQGLQFVVHLLMATFEKFRAMDFLAPNYVR